MSTAAFAFAATGCAASRPQAKLCLFDSIPVPFNSIARAILKNAPILILDEPTSSLDAISEEIVFAALRHLRAGRTTIVIAHRLSTVRDADRILVLCDGRIVQEGTYADLAGREGIFRELVAARELAHG